MTALLTVRQPFASLIVGGVKSVENRPRRISYRGRLGIHAGIAVWPGLSIPEAAHAMSLPRQAVLGTVNLVDCHLASPACAETCAQAGGWPNLCHWVLENPREFVTPIRHVRGQLGIWEAGPSVEHLMSIAEVVS